MSLVKSHHPILTISMTADPDPGHDLVKHRFVNAQGSLCEAGQQAIGVVALPADTGEQASVDVLGVLLVEYGSLDPLMPGQAVESDDDGRAMPHDEGAKAGIALDSPSGVGDIIRIVRGI